MVIIFANKCSQRHNPKKAPIARPTKSPASVRVKNDPMPADGKATHDTTQTISAASDPKGARCMSLANGQHAIPIAMSVAASSALRIVN
jgi:hypothetical protein